MSTMNMALYRLLVKMGTPEGEAEAAAAIDTAILATKDDLRAAIADLKNSLLMWIIVMLIAQTGLIVTVMRAIQP